MQCYVDSLAEIASRAEREREYNETKAPVQPLSSGVAYYVSYSLTRGLRAPVHCAGRVWGR